ncbi:hypothetical protein JCM13304A_21810 [Desulfothermus okinawensis JCM 13304]
MILFEFVCDDCKKEFEELVISYDDKVKCPYCGSSNVKKLLSAVNVKGAQQGPVASASSCSPSGGFS